MKNKKKKPSVIPPTLREKKRYFLISGRDINEKEILSQIYKKGGSYLVTLSNVKVFKRNGFIIIRSNLYFKEYIALAVISMKKNVFIISESGTIKGLFRKMEVS